MTQLGASSAPTENSPTRNDRVERYDPDANSDRFDRDSRDNRTADIPYDARRVSEGAGQLQFRAGSTGRIWVYDVRNRKVIYSNELLDGDYLTLSTADDRVYINDRTVSKIDLKDDRIHRLYFDGRRASGESAGRSSTLNDEDKNNRRETDRVDPDRRSSDDRNKSNTDGPARKPLVPDTAKLVVEGRDKALSFKADANGTAYLFDNTTNKLIDTFTIQKGQRITVSPAQGVVAVDGKTILERQAFSRKIHYRLLFNASNNR